MITTGRWGLAAVLATAILAAGIGGVAGSYLVNLRGAAATVAADHVPADALMYLEARLDLPGDQRAMFVDLLDRFPGIDAQRWMDEELGRWLDELMAEGGTDHRYSTDIEPWFDGRVALAVLDMPASADPFEPVLPEIVAFLGLTDAPAAVSFTDRLRSEAEAEGATFRSSSHRGVTIWSLELDAFTRGSMPGAGFAYAVTDRFVLLSMAEADLRRSLDVATGDGSRLADRDELRALAGRLPADRVTLATMDTGALLAQTVEELERSAPEIAETYRALLADQPDFAVMAGRLEEGQVRFIGVTDRPAGDLAVDNSRRDLATRVPADAFLFVDGSSLGESFRHGAAGVKGSLSAAPEGELILEQLEQFEMALNTPLEDLLAWAGDGALVAGWDGDQPYGGVLLQADDPGAAAQLLGRVTAMIGLTVHDPFLAELLTVSTGSIAGAEGTTVRISVPPEAGAGIEGLVVQYVLRDELVLIGFGDRFLGRVLDLEEADSLAETPRFRDAVQAVNGADSIGVFFLDLSAARRAMESALAAELETDDYRRDVRPNLEPFGYLVGASRVDGDVVETLMLLVFD